MVVTEKRLSFLSKLAPLWVYEQGKDRDLQYITLSNFGHSGFE